MKQAKTVFPLVVLLAVMLVIGGCAAGSKMQRTEEGYMPTHVVVGDIVAYTQGVAQVSTADLKEMIVNDFEMAFRDQGVKFISQRELQTTAMDETKLVKLNATVTFQQGASDISQSTDARISYQLIRAADGFLWEEGSAKSTDWSVSQGATVDVQSAVRFATQATAKDVKDLMK